MISASPVCCLVRAKCGFIPTARSPRISWAAPALAAKAWPAPKSSAWPGSSGNLTAILRDPANEGAPLELSLDLTVQAAAEQVLAGGMTTDECQRRRVGA